MMGRRARKGCRVSLLAVGALAGVILVGSTLKGRTMHRSEVPQSFASPNGEYDWLSSHEVLLTKYEGPDSQHLQRAFVRYDVSTGQQTRLSALTALFRQGAGGQSPILSPDKQWALWSSIDANPVILHLSRLDGKRHSSCAKAKAPYANPFYYWLPDSRHWAELVARPDFAIRQMRIHSVDAPQTLQTLPVPLTNPLNVYRAAFSEDIQAGGQHLVLIPCGSHGYCSVSKTLHVSTVGLPPGAEPARNYAFAPPPNVDLHSGVVLSPQGDRIAWFFGGERSGSLDAGLERLVAGPTPPSAYIQSLWVSKVDGSDMHLIAYQECNRPSYKFGDHMMPFASAAAGNLLWLPDGKHLSYLFHDRLYVVAIP